MKFRSHPMLPLRLAFISLAAIAFVACSVDVPDPGPGSDNDPPAAKGGGKKGSDAASAGQKGGSNASSHQSDATSQGAESDGLVCDASLESVGWCADDASIIFCSEESWWLLDCTAIDPDAFCGYDDELNIVDCYVLVDDECSELDEACADDDDCCAGLACDETGYCDDGGDVCLDLGESCGDDADCCSDICDETGTCDDGADECLDPGEGCGADTDCCSELCYEDGTCA